MSDATSNDVQPDATAASLALLGSLHEYAEHGIALFVTEARRAGLSLGAMLALAVALAVLGVSAWLLAMAALAALVAEAGVSLAASLALLALVNAVAGVACLLAMRRLSVNLCFTATRRMLARGSGDENVHAPGTA